MKDQKDNLLVKIVSLCKRRGFVFLGNELFNNIASLWWKRFVQERDDMVGIRGPIIMNPKVWEASGHLSSFTDPLVECKICNERFRADKEDELKEHRIKHINEGTKTGPGGTVPQLIN